MATVSSSDRRKYLYSQIVGEIQSMIQAGELKVGDRLPPERDLAQTFRVSRNCIRQAIQTLAEQQILESRRGDGTYVCAPDQALLVRSLAQAIQVQKELLKDILEFRLLVEPQIAYLAAQHITPPELDRLKIIVCDQERKLLAGEEDAALDVAFHRQLMEAARNQVIIQVISQIHGILEECRAASLQTDARRQASVIGHLKIIDALEAADPEKARQAMREHLLAVEQAIWRPKGAPGATPPARPDA